ncbi:hypothetical protein FB45DRAFT_1149674 [Roridomyces roridus]|uniref:Uncharacterized protein n=1 Tax=Roridomyces roridus TaxID=1738132 RepID=A0AAD7AZ50_9AGAR|nr:hypothetical protein FB45DRAFT_1149674 [Roridomyces roridus]
MSVFTTLLTLVKNTLVYIRSMVLRPFTNPRLRNPVLVAVAVGDVEKQVVAGPKQATKVLDVEKGMLDVVAPEIARPLAPTTPLKLKSSPQKLVSSLPLAETTNMPRTPPRRLEYKGKEVKTKENASPTQARTPLRRKARYLDLNGNVPLKTSPVKTSPSSAKSRPLSTPSFRLNGSPQDLKTSTPIVDVSHLRLEAGLASISMPSLNLTARIRSALYGIKVDHYDESLAARDLFSRDSVCSGFTLDGVIQTINGPEEEEVYGFPIRIQSTAYSPSKSSPSRLPYLRDRSSSVASTITTSSSGGFSQLLTTIEQKYPGTEWGDIVQFSNSADSITEEVHWSDVISLDDYAV